MGQQENIDNLLSKDEYSELMGKIDTLMKIGEEKLTLAQAAELRSMALAAQAYEKIVYTKP